MTVVALASATVFACGGDDAPAPAPARTSSIAPVETPVPVEEILPVPEDEERHLKVVEGILPSPAETSAILGLAPGVWALLGTGFGQELEHLDVTDSGITAGGAALFVPALTPAAGATPEGMYLSPADYHRRRTPAAGAPEDSMYLSLVFHDTPEHAERTYQHLRGELGDRILPGDERDTIADAVSSDSCCIIIIRQHTVTALVVTMLLDGRDVGGELRAFGRMLALGIDAFVRTQGP